MLRRLSWAPFLSLFYRELRRILRANIQTIFAPTISATLYLIIFGIYLGKKLDFSEGGTYLTFLIPGVIMLQCLGQAFANSTSSIMQLKYTGEIQDLKVAPFSSWQILMALSLASTIRGLSIAFFVLLIGQGIHFLSEGTFITIHSFSLTVFFAFLGGCLFSCLGIIAAFWAKSFEQVGAISGFLLQPLIYLGGVFYSIKILHPLGQKLSQFNPVMYVVNGFRYAILKQSDFSLEVCLIRSLFLILIFYIISYLFVKKSSYLRAS